MSYYILPKINNKVRINLVNSYINIEEPYISHSLFKYYNELSSGKLGYKLIKDFTEFKIYEKQP